MQFSRRAPVLAAAALVLTAMAKDLAGASSPTADPEVQSSAAYVLETGTLAEGAKFILARPVHWNRRVLLLAHPQRRADRPLTVELVPEQLARQAFLDEGWIIAATSFRRNGIVLADAMADLDALRAHIQETYGDPERVLLEGSAMGGLIVTLIAERDPTEPKLYDAAVAIGATLQLKEPNSSLGLTLQPKIPLLFLANQTELEAFRHYVDATVPLDEPALRPLLFRISRDGRANINQRERLFALRTLNLWLDHGRGAVPVAPPEKAHFDATIASEPQPSQVVVHPDGRGFDARITAVAADSGDLTLNAQPADFVTIGLGKMARFQVKIGDQTFRVVYGRIPESVKRGEWVTFSNADGFLILVRNRADAAASVRASIGDTLSMRRFQSATN